MTDMIRVSSTEFGKEVGRYQDAALTQPVVVTRNGRDRTVMISAEEYARLKRRDRQVFSTANMPEEIVEAVRNAKMDPRHNHLDELLKGLDPVSFPKPEPGLVIRYSYLWLSEHQEGREEGVKDRPCAIILATLDADGEVKTLVVPVTHSAPRRSEDALELPAVLKRQLGLDAERSWVVVSESNFFTWPGPDLRRVGDRDNSSIVYGSLPPKFFAELKRRWLAFEAAHGSRRVQRTE